MTWFITGLRHEAIRLSKKHKKQKTNELLILDDLVKNNDGDEKTAIINSLTAMNDTSFEAVDSIFLQEALSLLTLQQQKVVFATIIEEYTEQKVAKQLGISQPVVHRSKKRALTRMKKSLFLNYCTYK